MLIHSFKREKLKIIIKEKYDNCNKYFWKYVFIDLVSKISKQTIKVDNTVNKLRKTNTLNNIYKLYLFTLRW